MKKTFFSLLAVAGVALLTTTSAKAAITTGIITVDGFTSWAAGGNPSRNNFDTSGSNKLVVVVSGEHNFPNNYSGNITGITYDGQTLIKAVEQNPVVGVHLTAADIWYLDNPGSFHTEGVIETSILGSGNNYVYTALSLSNTALGVGATATASGAAALDLTTTAADSMVIFNLGTGGLGNSAGGTGSILPYSPAGATQIDALTGFREYAGQSVAGAHISSPSTRTFSFDTTKTDVVAIAAEFTAQVPEPGTFTLVALGLMSLLGIVRRRK